MLYYFFILIDRKSSMRKKVTFLGIETSCDETAAAIVKNNSDGTGEILSNIVSSQVEEHREFGGTVPEVAARAHVEKIEIVRKNHIQIVELINSEMNKCDRADENSTTVWGDPCKSEWVADNVI